MEQRIPREKAYNSAPLPFQGQKRNFVADFKRIIAEQNTRTPIKMVVDLFGGSGLLAHTAKRTLPEARVVYNDFDDFHIRLLNIDKTNAVLRDLRAILRDYRKQERFTPAHRAEVLTRLDNERSRGYVDYRTLSAAILFSSNYVLTHADLEKCSTLYNNVRREDYPECSADYLAGLEIFKADYYDLYRRFKDVPGVMFVVDPPYLSTDTQTYGSAQYWRLRDYLNVLRVLQGGNYIYFTSEKSAITDVCGYFEEVFGCDNPFSGATVCERQNPTAWNAKYTDMMLYKFAG
ncbi:MAG: DNA adenine methylase [Alistipes sp.]|nr:DNA adenine methylase [Alistipes sp.]